MTPPLPDRIAVRPVQPDDRDLLREIYASTRTEELDAVPWSDEQKAAFLAQQFEAQDHHYRANYDTDTFFVVLEGGRAVGRLYLHRLPGELRVVDVALLPAHRNRGVGGAVLRWVIALADAEHRSVSLHVERWNRARSLYERHGFCVTAESEVYLRMDRPAVS